MIVSRLLLAAAGLLALVSCGQAGNTENAAEEARRAPEWRPTAESPLTARFGAQAFWTGEHVLVIGGSDDDSCPPNADCEVPPPLPDGAAYDPKADSWSKLPDAPLPLGYFTAAVVDGTLYLWNPGTEPVPGARPAFLSLTLGDDAWRELEPPPPAVDESVHLVAAGDLLAAIHGSHEGGIMPDLVFDPDTQAWAELPLDPLVPAFDRWAVWADGTLVLTGVELVPNPNAERPALVGAARLDLASGLWQRFADSEILGWEPRWAWSNGRLVNATIGSSDGGEVNNWGRRFPHGGVLDPVRGEWSGLPDTPEAQGDFTGVWAAGEHWSISPDGWALHLASGTWVELARPAVDVGVTGQAATWAGDRLFVWGGATAAVDRTILSSEGWIWIPPEL